MNEDNRIISQANFQIPEGFQAETRITQSEQKPRYYRIGNGIRNTFMSNHTPIDTIDEMTAMTVQELWTIKLLKDNIILIEERTSTGYKKRTSCKSIILGSELTSAEKQKFKTGYKKLHDKCLVKRIKRQHYIMNPDMFIPHFYEEEKKLFDSLP